MNRKRKLDESILKKPNINDEDENELLKDIPFTEKELEEDYDEDEFMDKLQKYLDQKYADNDQDIDYLEEDINTNENNKKPPSKLSAFEILTMKEDELNKIMPINDSELIDDTDKLNQHSFKYIPTFSNDGNSNKRSKKRRKNNKYFKVPKLNADSNRNNNKKGNSKNKQQGFKKLSNNSRFTLKCKDSNNKK